MAASPGQAGFPSLSGLRDSQPPPLLMGQTLEN